MEWEKNKLKQFLLCDSTEKDAEEIGLRLLTDESLDEEMSLAEENLIEEFLDNELTAHETELFYDNFLTTPARVELLRETSRLRDYAQTHFLNDANPAAAEKKPTGLLESFRNFLTLNLRPVAAVLVVLVLAGVAWLVFLSAANDLSPLEKDYAVLNAKDLTNAPEAASWTSKSLVPGTFRDTAGDAAKLSATNLSENVLFRLALPAGAAAQNSLDLELVKAGQTVFRQKNLRVYRNPNGHELKVVLPKAVLPAGSYQIKLSSGATYAFAIE